MFAGAEGPVHAGLGYTGAWVCLGRRAERSYSMFKVRRGTYSKVRSSGYALLEQP